MQGSRCSSIHPCSAERRDRYGKRRPVRSAEADNNGSARIALRTACRRDLDMVERLTAWLVPKGHGDQLPELGHLDQFLKFLALDSRERQASVFRSSSSCIRSSSAFRQCEHPADCRAGQCHGDGFVCDCHEVNCTYQRGPRSTHYQAQSAPRGAGKLQRSQKTKTRPWALPQTPESIAFRAANRVAAESACNPTGTGDRAGRWRCLLLKEKAASLRRPRCRMATTRATSMSTVESSSPKSVVGAEVGFLRRSILRDGNFKIPQTSPCWRPEKR